MKSKVFMDKGDKVTTTLEIADGGDCGYVVASSSTTDAFAPQVTATIGISIRPADLRAFADAAEALARRYGV